MIRALHRASALSTARNRIVWVVRRPGRRYWLIVLCMRSGDARIAHVCGNVVFPDREDLRPRIAA